MQLISKIAVVLILLLTLFDCSNSLEPADTAIDYSFTTTSALQVRIEVENNYNTLITTLADQIFAQGAHSIRWQPDAQVLAGIYYINRYENDTLVESLQIALFGGSL